jgi:2-methylcitrate dehydratase
MIELMKSTGFQGKDIDRILVEIFDVAHLIIGGGVEGDKTIVRTKEEADHSLPYMVAAAALDGQVMPEQYEPGRIARDDIQSLLARVTVLPDPGFSRRFPEEHACRLTVVLKDGRSLIKEKYDYEGFHTRPMSWAKAEEKFHRLAEKDIDIFRRTEIVDAVRRLDLISVRNLMELLG